MAMLLLLRRLKSQGDKTVHGFRSTFRDWAAEQTNFPREIAEAALAQMADVRDTTIYNINKHIKGIYKDGELDEKATIDESSIVQKEGGRAIKRNVQHYNLDMVISVACRVNSKRGVRFRQWATKVLKEHLTKGYTLNSQRLEKIGKNSKPLCALFGKPQTRHP